MRSIGSIIHGALGDCYEQLWAIRELRKKRPSEKWIGFFAHAKRFDAMQHFDLSMLDEVYLAEKIEEKYVDEFYQYQIKDEELLKEIIYPLPRGLKEKFDFVNARKPWHDLRNHDFIKKPSHLELSDIGKKYLPECMKYNEISDQLFNSNFTVGFLWRYRKNVGMAKSYFNRSKEWVLKTKNELFNKLISDYNAHIIVAGMNKDLSSLKLLPDEIKEKAAFREGEYKYKVAEDQLDLPSNKVSFLKGLGFAQEMEIMSKCNLLLLMPSGFSEPLWMRCPEKTILLDPVSLYSVKLIFNRMPLFSSKKIKYFLYNYLTPHTSNNVIKFLKQTSILPLKD